MVNNPNEDLFIKKATEIQENIFNNFEDKEWHSIEKADITILYRKVGFGLYGPADSLPTEENLHTGFETEKLSTIKEISNQLIENLDFDNRRVDFSCIFIVGKKCDNTDFILPVFKSKGENCDLCIYVDSKAKRYTDWDDFFINNDFLKSCTYCYPGHGRYERCDGQIHLKCAKPRYEVNSEELCNIVENTDFLNAFEKAHSIVSLIDKRKKNELTDLDVFQFRDLLLFYKNDKVSFNTASNLLDGHVIESFEKQLEGPAKELYVKHTTDVCDPTQIVEQLIKVIDVPYLYRVMTGENVTNDEVKLTENGYVGLLCFYKTLKIHPMKVIEIPQRTFRAMCDTLRDYQLGNLTQCDFLVKMKYFGKEFRIHTESEREETLNKLCAMYGKKNLSEIEVGGRQIFLCATNHEKDRLTSVIHHTIDGNKEMLLQVVHPFAEEKTCATVEDYIAYTEYVASYIKEEIKILQDEYDLRLSMAQEGPDFNMSKFIKDYGIVGKRAPYFLSQVIKKLFCNNGPLHELFDSLKPDIAVLNQTSEHRFFSDISALYHFYKHKTMGEETLTPESYYKLAEEVLSNIANITNDQLSQDGSCRIQTFVGREKDVKVLRIVKPDSVGIASIMYDPGGKVKLVTPNKET